MNNRFALYLIAKHKPKELIKLFRKCFVEGWNIAKTNSTNVFGLDDKWLYADLDTNIFDENLIELLIEEERECNIY